MDGRHDSAVLCSDRVLAARVDGGRRCKVTLLMEECRLPFEREHVNDAKCDV